MGLSLGIAGVVVGLVGVGVGILIARRWVIGNMVLTPCHYEHIESNPYLICSLGICRQDATVCCFKDSSHDHSSRVEAHTVDNGPSEYVVPNMSSSSDVGDRSDANMYTSLQVNEYETIDDEYIHQPSV